VPKFRSFEIHQVRESQNNMVMPSYAHNYISERAALDACANFYGVTSWSDSSFCIVPSFRRADSNIVNGQFVWLSQKNT